MVYNVITNLNVPYNFFVSRDPKLGIKCRKLGSVPLQKHNRSGTVVVKCYCIKVKWGVSICLGVSILLLHRFLHSCQLQTILFPYLQATCNLHLFFKFPTTPIMLYRCLHNNSTTDELLALLNTQLD